MLFAAATVFEAVGYGRASLRHIAESAGASLGVLYFHFPSKTDLAKAIIVEHRSRVQGLIFEARLGKRGIDALISVALAYFDALSIDVVIRAGIRLSAEWDVLTDPVEESRKIWIAELSEMLIEAKDAGDMRPGLDPQRLAVTMLAWVVGVQATCRTQSDERSGESYFHDQLLSFITWVTPNLEPDRYLLQVVQGRLMNHVSPELDDDVPPIRPER